MSHIGNPPVVQASRVITELVATAGQTDIYPLGGYTPGDYLDVEINGSALKSTDYTATDGVKITLAVAMAAGDDVRVKAYGNFLVGNAVPADGTVTTAKLAAQAVTAAKLAAGAARANFGAGAVLQVVSATLGAAFSTSSGQWTGTGLSASITPSSQSSKFISIATLPITNSYGSYNTDNYAIRLNGVAGPDNTGNGSFQLTNGTGSFITTLHRFDSPNSVSSQTFDVAIAMSGGTSIGLGKGAQLTVMEIAG